MPVKGKVSRGIKLLLMIFGWNVAFGRKIPKTILQKGTHILRKG
jgi:hypothetical protein